MMKACCALGVRTRYLGMSPRGEIAHPRAPIKSPEEGAVNLGVFEASNEMVDGP
jgi:hypothetical protein